MLQDAKNEVSQELQELAPKCCITLFDFFHFYFTLLSAIYAAVFLGKAFGILLGIIAFVATAIISFYVLGHTMGAFVLFLHHRYSPKCRIGHEAACYVLAHFKRER